MQALQLIAFFLLILRFLSGIANLIGLHLVFPCCCSNNATCFCSLEKRQFREIKKTFATSSTLSKENLRLRFQVAISTNCTIYCKCTSCVCLTATTLSNTSLLTRGTQEPFMYGSTTSTRINTSNKTVMFRHDEVLEYINRSSLPTQ